MFHLFKINILRLNCHCRPQIEVLLQRLALRVLPVYRDSVVLEFDTKATSIRNGGWHSVVVSPWLFRFIVDDSTTQLCGDV